ncbi:hypothetical protein [Nonomuraea insulae]|uniref:Resolvase/invertase-type recombinase catalytic domain-containing protein n=1 Tax=Nonomuraea insulae TaxID=1616787 RepID=A0ABW1D5H1_9ACTN
MTHVSEQRAPSGVVCGYLRLMGMPARKAAGLRLALDDYCLRHGLLLAAVCTERVRPTCGRAVAFTALLDIIAIREVVGVIMPSPTHLGPAKLAAARTQLIHDAGSELFFVRSRLRNQAPAMRRPGT